MKRLFKCFCVCLLLLAMPAAAQMKTRVQKSRYVSPADGKQLYAAYCAGCHGDNLTSTPVMKQAVAHNTDLTRVAQTARRDVAFKVQTRIMHGSPLAEHPVNMPSWKSVLRNVYNGDEGRTALAIRNLTAYIVSQQQ